MGYSRRNFAGTSAVETESPLIKAHGSLESSLADDEDGLLKNVCDIHVHAVPDIKERSVDEIDFALDAKNAGYRAVMYKSNAWSCHDRAFLVRYAMSEFECFGSLCMNAYVGDRVKTFEPPNLRSIPREIYASAYGCLRLIRYTKTNARAEKERHSCIR